MGSVKQFAIVCIPISCGVLLLPTRSEISVNRMNDEPRPARKPIVYRTETQVRFTDIDRYNHVGAIAYLDFIFTSRLEYPRVRFGVTAADFLARNIGFFVAEIHLKFARPIDSAHHIVKVESHVPSVNGARFSVEFSIMSKDEVVHATGTLVMRIIDLKTGKPTDAPDWVLDLMFEPAEST